MCAASTLFPIMNGIVQILSPRYPSEQIIWARTAGHLLIVLVLIVPRFGIGVLATRRPGAQIWRSLLLLASTTLFFFAVKDVPLAKAASISFLAPFFVTLLALPMLGERIDPKRLAAVTVGFLGVLVVIRPGTEMFQPAALLIVGSAFCYAVYQVLTRKVAYVDGLERVKTLDRPLRRHLWRIACARRRGHWSMTGKSGQSRSYVRPFARRSPLAIMGVRLRARHHSGRRASCTEPCSVLPGLP